MILKMELLSNLKEALALALIRNQCRYLLTNDQQEISPLKQTNWFKQIYTQQNPHSYWIWLLKETIQNDEAIIGYFAAREDVDGIYITEGLLEEKRGRGLGTFMLNSMIYREFFNKRPLFADIFNHNLSSIYLHKKFGFEEHIKVNDQTTRFIKKFT